MAGNGGGTTLENVVIDVLTDEGLRDHLGGVLAAYLRLEEGSAEREFFQQITLDLFALLQDDSSGSFKAFLKGALGEFLEQPDVKNLISDVIGVATGRLGGIIEELQEQNVLDEVPNMFKLWWEDFLNRTTGEGGPMRLWRRWCSALSRMPISSRLIFPRRSRKTRISRSP